MDVTKMTALELGRKIRTKDVSVVEATEQYLGKIEEKEPSVHAYLSVWHKQALERAAWVQKEIEEGKYAGSLLAGVPIAIKDNICTKGEETTCASKLLNGFRPPYDAQVVYRIKEAGMVILGKTNMDEFAMGSTTETSAGGVTRNPHNTAYVPGGSSGGSAAAVAAGETPLALGSDTGGSIRQPSSFCGIVGMKPTYGRVSRYGLIAYASSMDQIGPMAGNVADAAALLEVISGHDKKDATSLPQKETSYYEVIEEGRRGLEAITGGQGTCKKVLSGIRIGIPQDYFGIGLDKKVSEQVLAAAEQLRALGAEVEEMNLSLADYAVPAYYVIACAEASSNLSRYDGVKYGYRTPEYRGLQELYRKTRTEGFGEEVKRRLLIGSFVLSSGYYEAYYKKALKVRACIQQEFDHVFGHYDILLEPTAPASPPRLGESLTDPLKMYVGDVYTVAANLAGLPGISVPCGTDEKGLPIGMQLVGKPLGERILLKTAYAYEYVREHAVCLGTGGKNGITDVDCE